MNQSLAEKSYVYIRQKLARGEFAPGKRLVNRTLADEIGVSVIPVREAIGRLASEGLVQHVPGAGAYVRTLSRQDLDNLYVLRDALESCAAAEAARFITDAELAELQEILQRAKDTAARIEEQTKGHATKRQMNDWLDDEQHFHELLIEASRNPVLAKVVEDNRAIGNVFGAQREDPSLLTATVARETCGSKAKLVTALQKRDSELARKLMSDQIQRGRKVVLAHFSRQRRRSG